jgi:nucleoid-associated protein YgaU
MWYTLGVSTSRGTSIGLIIALTLIVGSALVWDRLFRIPLAPSSDVVDRNSLLVVEHGGVPPRARIRTESPPQSRDRPDARRSRTEPPPKKPTRFHVVKDGESLSVISSKIYGTCTRWMELAAANDLREPYVIRTGQKIRIP